ncbi:hypothetical protein OQH60_06255 [Campylobacter sp. MIT 21-1685]|uniref:hypothetical protein n=1 Tax=unclassified Campylobacter TaxID=2593542 RepID=UPI00224B60A0|nr:MULTISPECIES: hypothetical protein [unclassified Campylobacter]MCX2683431.1 hypothetical protein [Campylobacter sp. MIT 21-1684]MCX2751748.1 hypothetical protein [Campylobacter sp. MIT 21-1682]MCX2807949.1 hypothetical protein [Campylobacter sp. MIT 21-1685]
MTLEEKYKEIDKKGLPAHIATRAKELVKRGYEIEQAIETAKEELECKTTKKHNR